MLKWPFISLALLSIAMPWSAAAADCNYSDHLSLGPFESTLDGADVYRACETITLVNGYTVGSAGEVLLEAGQRVSFQPGVSVQAGGRLRARVGALSETFRLEGAVVNAPVADATVTVFPPTGPLTALATTSTAADGTFALDLPQDAPFWVRSQGGALDGSPYSGELWGWCAALTGCLVTPWSTVQYELVHENRYTVADAAQLMEEAGFSADPFADTEQPFDLSAARSVIGQGGGLHAWIDSVAQWLRDPSAAPPAGWDYPLATLTLEPIEVIEGRRFEWEVSIEAPVSPIVAIEWEQVSGVPIDILQGRAARLVADAPFVAASQVVELLVRATDDRGGVVQATSTISVDLSEPTYVPLTGVVDLPADILPSPADTLQFATVLAEQLEVVSDSDFPMLVIAKDADGWVLLAAANRDGGLFGEAYRQVVFSIDSTAVVLMALAVWEPIPSLTTARVERMQSSPGYPGLTAAIGSLLRADKNFLERMDQYPDLRDAIDRAVEGIPVEEPPEALESQTYLGFMERTLPLQFAQGYGEEKAHFYCVPWIRWPCSPWNADQPWIWFGAARGAEVFLPESAWPLLGVSAGLVLSPTLTAGVIIYYLSAQWAELIKEGTLLPFLARSADDYSLHALANPNYINYALEAYSGADRQFWMLVPRNATVLTKLRNSGAAKRAERAAHHRRLSPEIDRIAFHRYRLTSNSRGELQPDHAAVVSFLNLLSMSVALANVATDVSAVLKALEDVDAEDSVNLTLCAAGFLAGEDLYFDASMSGIFEQTQDFLRRYAGSAVWHMVTSEACGNVTVKGGKKLATKLKSAKLMAVFDGAINKLTVGGKAAFDTVNDLAPVATSFFSGAAAGVEYYLEWYEHHGQPYIHRVTTTKTPGAMLSATQLSGMQVRLDASASSHDSRTSLTYAWGLVTDLQGSGYQFIGSGAVLDYHFALPGAYIVELRVTDGFGFTDRLRSTVEVTPGRVPVIQSLVCSLQDAQLRMQISLSDPDQRVTSIGWFADVHSSQPDLTTAAGVPEVVLSTTPVTGGNWARVEVNVFDGETSGRTCWTEAPSLPMAAGRLTVSFDPIPALASQDHACLGYTPAWRYSATVEETAGVDVLIQRFEWDFYDGAGNYLNTQVNTGADFAEMFTRCGPGNEYLGGFGRACANLCVHRSGSKDLGSVVMRFLGVDDFSNDVVATGEQKLERISGALMHIEQGYPSSARGGGGSHGK